MVGDAGLTGGLATLISKWVSFHFNLPCRVRKVVATFLCPIGCIIYRVWILTAVCLDRAEERGEVKEKLRRNQNLPRRPLTEARQKTQDQLKKKVNFVVSYKKCKCCEFVKWTMGKWGRISRGKQSERKKLKKENQMKSNEMKDTHFPSGNLAQFASFIWISKQLEVGAKRDLRDLQAWLVRDVPPLPPRLIAALIFLDRKCRERGQSIFTP